MLTNLSFVAAVLSTFLLTATAAPASPAAELERRQDALTTTDGLVGSLLNLTAGLRRDTAELSMKPRQLDSITGIVPGLLGGLTGAGPGSPPSTSSSSTPVSGSSSPLEPSAAEPSSAILPRQGVLTGIDTVLTDVEALGGAVRRDEVEFKLEHGDKTVDMKYDMGSLDVAGGDDDDDDCDEDQEDVGDTEESHEPEADEDEDEEEEDESDEEDELTK